MNTGFVDLAVAELLSEGYIQTVSARPYICSPLSEAIPFQLIGCVLCTILAYWSIGLCAVYHSSLLEYWSVCCVPFQPIGVLVCVLCTIPAYWSIGLCAVYHSSLLEYWSVCCVPFQPIGVLVCVLCTIPAYCVLLRWRAQVRLHQLLCDKEL